MLLSGEEADSRFAELGSSGFALAVQMLHDREDAADAVQDSLYSALRKRHRFDSRRGSLRAWFLKIVRNRCLDMLRRRARHGGGEVEWSEVCSLDHAPDEMAEKRELLTLVRRELMAMPEEQREIILLRDFHNLSYADVAQVLSIPVGTVMSRLHRARNELRRRLQEYR
jgi:RNA polymerase sigma-70 factor (ECF subfamily)